MRETTFGQLALVVVAMLLSIAVWGNLPLVLAAAFGAAKLIALISIAISVVFIVTLPLLLGRESISVGCRVGGVMALITIAHVCERSAAGAKAVWRLLRRTPWVLYVALIIYVFVAYLIGPANFVRSMMIMLGGSLYVLAFVASTVCLFTGWTASELMDFVNRRFVREVQK